MKRKVENAFAINDEFTVDNAIKRQKIERGEDRYDFSGDGLQQALAASVLNGSYEVFLRLLQARDRGEIIAIVNFEELLNLAASKGYLVIVEHLLKLEAGPSKILGTDSIHTACFIAGSNGQEALISWFLERELIDINKIYEVRNGKSNLLIEALLHGHFNVAKILLQLPDIDPTLLEYGALQAAYELSFRADCDYKIFSLLLENKKIDPTYGMNYPLRVACSLNLAKTVKSYLQNHTIDHRLATNYYIDFFNKSTEFGEDSIDRIIERLPNDNQFLTEPYNLLEQACRNGCVETAAVLLQHTNLDPSADKNRVLELACLRNHGGVVNLLLKDKRVNPTLDFNRCLKNLCSDPTGESAEIPLKILLDHPQVEASLIAYPNMFKYLVLILMGTENFRSRYAQFFLPIILDKIKALNEVGAFSLLQVFNQENWIQLAGVELDIPIKYIEWAVSFIHFDELDEPKFYKASLMIAFDYKFADRVEFYLNKGSHCISEKFIKKLYNDSFEESTEAIIGILFNKLRIKPSSEELAKSLSLSTLNWNSPEFDVLAELLFPYLLPEPNASKVKALLTYACKQSPPLLKVLFLHKDLDLASDNYHAIFLAWKKIYKNSNFGSDEIFLNWCEEVKQLNQAKDSPQDDWTTLQLLVEHPSVNIEQLLENFVDDKLFTSVLKIVCKPELRLQQMLFEKYKLLTLFGASLPQKALPEDGFSLARKF